MKKQEIPKWAYRNYFLLIDKILKNSDSNSKWIVGIPEEALVRGYVWIIRIINCLAIDLHSAYPQIEFSKLFHLSNLALGCGKNTFQKLMKKPTQLDKLRSDVEGKGLDIINFWKLSYEQAFHKQIENSMTKFGLWVDLDTGQTSIMIGDSSDNDTVPFNPETDIPKILWKIMENSKQDSKNLKISLKEMPRKKILFLFQAFEDAKTELVDVLSLMEKCFGFSEDSLEDLADAIITSGEKSYINSYRSKNLPNIETLLTLPTSKHIFFDAYQENYNTNILDDLDDR